MSEDRKYVRVYYSIIEDEKFSLVYPDDRVLATWLRLLMDADAHWPAPAPLPRWVRPAPLETLVSAGIVDPVGPLHYRMRGLDNERSKRGAAARKGADARWSDSSASAMQTHSERTANGMPRRAEDEQSKDEQTQTDPVVAYMRLTGTGRPSEYAANKLRANAARYGHDEWLFAVNQARDLYGSKNDIRNAESIAEQALLERQAEAKKRKDAELAASRVTPEQAEAQRRAIYEKQAEILGWKKGAA